jgi:hypothetical protein
MLTGFLLMKRPFLDLLPLKQFLRRTTYRAIILPLVFAGRVSARTISKRKGRV